MRRIFRPTEKRIPNVIGPSPRSKATRQGLLRMRFQLKAATTINTVEGKRIDISATRPLSSAQRAPSFTAAPIPSRPTIIELGPGEASAMA